MKKSNPGKPSAGKPYTGNSYTGKSYRQKKDRYISTTLRYLVLNRDRFRCALCGRSPLTDPSVELHLDHIIPFSKGGTTTSENLQTLCRECNMGKGSMPNPPFTFEL